MSALVFEGPELIAGTLVPYFRAPDCENQHCYWTQAYPYSGSRPLDLFGRESPMVLFFGVSNLFRGPVGTGWHRKPHYLPLKLN